jgi:hypothetical protein
MRLDPKRSMATMMFAHRFTGYFSVRDKKATATGITTNTAIPRYIA